MDDDFDFDEFYRMTGIDARFLRDPNLPPDPPLSSVGAQAQARLLHSLDKINGCLEIMKASVSDLPERDAAFDAINLALGQCLNEAGEAFQRFRERRDCKGAC